MAVGTVSYSRSGAYRFPMHTGDVLIHANLNEVVSLAYNLMAHFSWDPAFYISGMENTYAQPSLHTNAVDSLRYNCNCTAQAIGSHPGAVYL